MALNIPLTKGMSAIIDECDSHLAQWKWCLHSMGYASRGFWNKDKKAGGKHGIMLLHHAIIGRPLNGFFVDHINGNRLDNRRENLRIVSRRQNCQNTPRHRGEKTKSSRFIGVDKQTRNYGNGVRDYWRSKIFLNGKPKHLGYFKTEEAASVAYKKALNALQEKSHVAI